MVISKAKNYLFFLFILITFVFLYPNNLKAGNKKRMTVKGPQNVGLKKQAEKGIDKSLLITPSIGFITPASNIPLGLYTGVRTEYKLPFLGRVFFTGVSLNFSTGSDDGIVQDQRLPGGNITFSTRVYDIPVLIEAGYSIPKIWRIKPYAGFGIGFLWEKAIQKTPYETMSQNGSGFASELFFGIETFRIGPGEIDVRLGFNYLQEELYITDANQHGGFYFLIGYSIGIL